MASDRFRRWGFTRKLAWSWIGLVAYPIISLYAIVHLVLDLSGKVSGTQLFGHVLLFFFSAVYTLRFFLNFLSARRKIAQEYVTDHATKS